MILMALRFWMELIVAHITPHIGKQVNSVSKLVGHTL